MAKGKELLAKKDLEGHKALMAEIDSLNAEIGAMEKQPARLGLDRHRHEAHLVGVLGPVQLHHAQLAVILPACGRCRRRRYLPSGWPPVTIR